MASLEGLPQEILEMIFLYSMNMALPRASPRLGAALSSRHVTLAFTMEHFFHTVDYQLSMRMQSSDADTNLQSDILACRFFTYPFFMAYVQRAHDTWIKLRGKYWRDLGVVVPGADYFDSLFVYKFTQVQYLGFGKKFYIPEKLLHAPFTKDKVSLLYILVAFCGEIDWAGSMAGETAKTGIKEAIKEGNEYAVASLAVLLGVPKAITTEMIRYAVIDCGCEFSILRHLLFNGQILAPTTSKDILDFHDPTLWTWAVENPLKGELLTTMLKKADEFDLEFYFEKDVDWTKIVGFPYGGSKFDTRTTFNELVREMLSRLYSNYGRRIMKGGRHETSWLVEAQRRLRNRGVEQ